MNSKLSQIAEEFVADCLGDDCSEQCRDLESRMYDFEKTIDKQLRPLAKDVCILLLGSADYKCTSCPPNQKAFLEYGRDTTFFIYKILRNLKALVNSNLVASVVKQQLALIQCKLEEYAMPVVSFNLSITEVKKLYETMSRSRTWFTRISCLTYLYWSDAKDEPLTSTMETVIFGLLHITMPISISGVISSHLKPTKIPELLLSHLDFLLKNYVIPMKDDIEILHEGLIFFLSFIMDPPDESEDRGMIWFRIRTAINKFPSLISSIRSGEMERGSGIGTFCDLVCEIDAIQVIVQELSLETPYSSQIRSPKNNVIAFLSYLTATLKQFLEDEDSLIPSLKPLYELLQIELVSLMPVFENMVEFLQDGEQGEIQDVWMDIINMVYNADYFIKLSHLRCIPAWYVIIALRFCIERMKYLKKDINDYLVGVEQMHHERKLGDQLEEIDALRPQGTTSEIEIVSVGFIEDERVIKNELTRGQKSLTGISISGSGGQGKTTLAKRIYNDLSIRYHFQKAVWCYVSKDCPITELLVHILSNVGRGDDARKLGMHDLADKVRKSLKEKRYLIVMDDIWDADTWSKIAFSFPDDKNGSRILFTTRIRDLVSQVDSKWISHPLPLLSNEESWDLMMKKIIGSEDISEELVGIGKEIASYCSGLPLAVVLIAAVLGRTERSLNSWIKVAENVKDHLTDEGCGKVLELSYRYLPYHLKSCFLYFGAFQRGEEVKAKELKLLWIGEGFINLDGVSKSSDEDLATKYLNDLVSRGLVVVTEKGSMGGIKRCNVHDLLYDLCLEKCKENNFVNWAEESDVIVGEDGRFINSKSGPIKYNHHRLRIGISDHFINLNPIVSDIAESPLHSLLWSNNSYRYGIESSIWILWSFKILTVLKLELEYEVYEFPEVILSNIYLRYLKLHCRGITGIPPEIANLCKLRTLIIQYIGDDTQLPLSLWSMKSLRHVEIDCGYLNLYGFDNKSFSDLFGGASDIVTLGYLYLHKYDRKTAEFLRRFVNVRKLSCYISEDHIFKLFSMIGSALTQLKSLIVCRTGYTSLNPYEGTRMPKFLRFAKIENLNKLSLSYTHIPYRVLSMIGKMLPNLQVLILFHYACVGKIWRLKNGDFSKLMQLKVNGLYDLEEIDTSSCDDTPFPSLEDLVLQQCTRLKKIPSCFGEIDTLKMIKVSGCKKQARNSAMEIAENQREFGNNSFQLMVTSDTDGGDEDEVAGEDVG